MFGDLLRLKVRNRGAGILTFTAPALCLWFIGAVSVVEFVAAIMDSSRLQNHRRQPAIKGIKKEKTPHSSGLWWREDLPQDPIL
jgi:hypothetical protein